MSYEKKVSVGLKVDLIVQEGEYRGRYRTRIEEVGEKVLSIGAPFEQGKAVPLREGTKVKIIFCDEASAYAFEAEIMQRIAVPLPVFVIELPDSIAKVQRRSYVRVPAGYSIIFQMVTREGLSSHYKGTLLNLSGGGMRFVTEKYVENKSLLYVQLILPNEELKTPARVIRVEKKEDIKLYNLSVEFQDLAERERDRIIRCVFDIQRDMRKKGLV